MPGYCSAVLIRGMLWGHIVARRRASMDGKAKYIFPILITAIIVFVVSGVVTWTNIGFRFDFVGRWLSAFAVGWPVAAVTAFVAIPFVRRATARLVTLIEART